MNLLDRVPSQVQTLRHAIREFRPDCVVADAMLYAGAAAATLESLPWASLSTNLVSLAPPEWDCAYLRILDRLSGTREQLMTHLNTPMEFRGSEAISPYLNTVFTTEAFIPRTLSHSDFTSLVGPCLAPRERGDEPDFPWGELPDDKQVVYASFGSVVTPPDEVLVKLAEAFRGTDVHLVLAARSKVDLSAFVADGHVTVVPYAPQLAVLRRASAMVSHGGANSVMECLHQGKPLLVIPLAFEQPLQARFVEASGCGVALDLADFSTERCHELVMGLLKDDGAASLRAQDIGHSYRKHDGAARVAELVDALI